MKKRFVTSILSVLACALLIPGSVFAAEYAYATEIVSSNYRILTPNAALGAPDGFYASFLKHDAEIMLGFGGAEATGNVTLTYQLTQFGAGYDIKLFDKDLNVVAQGGSSLPTGQQEILFPYEGSYSYILIGSTEDEKWNLDAVTVEKTSTSSTSTPLEPTPTEETSSIPQGLLVKLVDDGDATTTADAAVYIIGGDGMRHAFPTESIFRSWFPSYENVALIDAEHLASYPLGKNVTVRPGTALVKLTTDPKVYAVEPGGKLRWIASETVANTLYGKDWAKRVMDVSDVFFGNYTIGEPIYTAVHPDGSIGVLSTGEVVYLENGLIFSLPGTTADHLNMNPDYYVPMFGEFTTLYVDGGELVLTPRIQFPY